MSPMIPAHAEFGHCLLDCAPDKDGLGHVFLLRGFINFCLLLLAHAHKQGCFVFFHASDSLL